MCNLKCALPLNESRNRNGQVPRDVILTLGPFLESSGYGCKPGGHGLAYDGMSQHFVESLFIRYGYLKLWYKYWCVHGALYTVVVMGGMTNVIFVQRKNIPILHDQFDHSGSMSLVSNCVSKFALTAIDTASFDLLLLPGGSRPKAFSREVAYLKSLVTLSMISLGDSCLLS